MKLTVLRSIFIIAVTLAAVGAWAETWTDPDTGYTWTYQINGDGAEIYNGGSVAVSPSPSGAVTIPATLGGFPVVSIGESAFIDCRGFYSISIPGCVTNIGAQAFKGCNYLSGVDIPSAVSGMGEYAFFGCSNLRNVILPTAITHLSQYVFSSCTLLESVTIPDNVVNIDQCAFYCCRNLRTVSIGNHVTKIGSSAFSCCEKLTGVMIPPSVSIIAGNAFSSCGALKSFVVSGDSPYYKDDAGLLLTKTGDELVAAPGGLTDVTIPNGVRNIGCESFRSNESIERVTIPGTVTNIEDSAFNHCSALKNLEMREGLVHIGNSAFAHCYSLEKVSIPSSVVDIEEDAFAYCDAIRSVAIPQFVCVDKFSLIFKSAYTIVTNIVISEGVTNIGEYAFNGCSNLNNIVIPQSVTSIGIGAFSDCNRLSRLILPFALSSIEDHVFFNCSDLADVDIPLCVTNIGNSAFYNCNSVANVIIPDGVERIGAEAFRGCQKLSNVTIPSSVKSIGDEAFTGCGELTMFLVSDGNAFYESVSGLLLTKDGRRLIHGVNREIAIPEGVQEIGEGAFSGCLGLTSVEIPESVTRIGGNAFASCANLTNLSLPNTLTYIRNFAFWRCVGLTSVTIPANVVSIGHAAFFGCTGLTEIYLPDGCYYDNSPYNSATIPSWVHVIKYKPRQLVFFNPCEGSVEPESIVVSYGSTYGLLPCPSREGHSFDGWLYDDKLVTEETVVSALGDHTLVAQWKVNQYVVTFDSNGGIGGKSVTLDYGTSLVAPLVTKIGHVFKGWQPVLPMTVPAENGTYTALWKANQYTVTFDANGGTGGKSVTQDYGSAIVAPTVTREGYTFTGWSSIVPATIPAENVTYTAQWKANQYTVTFNADGGTGGSSVTQDYGSALVAPAVTREGYTFTGWLPSVPSTVPAVNVTYTAQWDVSQYTQAFDANGGTGGNSVTQDYGSALVAPTLTREGYTFTGWSPAVPATVPAENITYTAQWRINQYAMTFNANGGDGGTVKTQDYGTALVAPTVTRTGYTFTGWSPALEATVPAMDVTYTAQWKINQYSVTFNANGGEGGTSVLQDYGSAIVAPTVSCTEGVFKGWNPAVDVMVPDHDVTYVAQWDMNQYTVTFNANGGTGGKTVTQDYGSAIVPPTVTREGYTFNGWSPSVPTTVPAANATYTAQWKVNQYMMTFNANGGTGGTTKTQNYGTSLSAPTVTRTGYTFTGWSPAVPTTVPAANATYTAQWKINQYTVTFEGNGGALGERALPSVATTQDYGSVIAAPTVRNEWCTFMGWSPAVAATVPANDVTYTAQWQRYGDTISASKMGGKTMRELYPSDCARMTTVELEEGITELPVGFFDGCDNVEFVTWPSTLREFGIDAVPPKIRASLTYDANGFMIYNNWILDYQDRGALAVTIPEGIVGIGRGAFKGMVKLITVTMPESLRCIAMGAFANCTLIHEFQFMSGLRYVGPVAFRNCTQLQGVVFADGVEHIGTNAFDNCWRMTSVDLPYTVMNVGKNAFSGCDGITGVTVPTHVKTMRELFPASYAQIKTAEVSEGETTVMDDMFKGCVALRGGATRIDKSMIPFTVTNIGARAFQNCVSLTAFIVPDSVTEIGASVFNGCTALKEVTLSSNLTAIPDYAFYGCASLPSLDIPASVAYLGQQFFSGRVPEPGQTIVDTLNYCCSNAPAYHPDAYKAISGKVCTRVFNGSCGWDGIPGSTSLPRTWPDRYGQDIDFWDPPQIDVTFNANGGWFDLSGGSTWTEQQTYGYTYKLPSTDPVWSGGDFQGWYTSPKGGTKIEDNKTIVTATQPQELFAHWISLGDKITVKFNVMGGSLEPEEEERDYPPGQTYKYLPPPVRLGYRFDGWFTAQEGGDLITEATLVRPSCKLLFAHWTPITYYVRFHANGGTGTMADQPFIYGEHNTLSPCLFTRAGFNFIGWATTPVGQVLYEERGSTDRILEEVNEEIVNLYAVWSGAGYTVRFDANGGTGYMDPQTIAIGETRNLRTCAFARAGYTFVGWALSPTKAEAKEVAYRDGEAVRNLSTVNSADVPLYAVWMEDDNTVRITFDANGGSVAPNDYWDCVVGTAVEAFPTPTRPGFTFAGWWTAKTGGELVESIARVTSAQTFYAHWTENGSVVPGDWSCTVTFNANGGSVSPTTRKVESGMAVGDLPTPLRMGYSFVGWFTAATGGTQVTASTVVRASVTYYAHWQYVGSADATTIVIEVQQSYEAEPDGTFPLEMSELVGSTSTPKLSVKGLPTGLKYDSKTMTISGTATKPGVYKVTVSATNATVKKPVTAEFNIVVPNFECEALPGLLPATDAYGVVMCGVAFDPGLVNCAPENGWTLKAAGLPSGLKLVQDKNTKAYSITGVPTKAGTYTVTFTATKKGEANQVATITLNVEAAPEWAVGTFAGWVAGTRDACPYQGSATMTVAANGKVSGKIALDGTNWTFKADSYSRVDRVERVEGDVETNFVVEAVATAGKAKRAMELRVASGGFIETALPGGGGHAGRVTLPNGVVTGTMGDDCDVRMWRNVWKDKATAAAAKAEIANWEGVYTLSLDPGPDYGSGYLSLTVGKDGNVKATGKLADGTSARATSPLMYDEDNGWFAYLYVAPNAYKGGAFAAAVGFGGHAGRVTLPCGPALWTSRNAQATGEYGEGFVRDVAFTGAYYSKLDTLRKYYEALRFTADSPTLNGAGATAGTSGEIAVDAQGKLIVDRASGLTLSFAQATGIFKGGSTLVFDAKTKKKVSFEGIMVQGEDEMRGFYLWDASSSYNDPKTGKEKAYKYKQSFPVSLIAE